MRLVESVVQPYEINDYRIRSSVSIGIAVGPEDGKNADDLLMAADLALYAVKGTSRGTFQFYHSSMNKDLNDRRQIELDLREAIERKELELHYQPIINVRHNVVSGFEALARWRHPVKGMVPPAVFIPVAEDSGLIVPLGEWALMEACRNAAQWPGDLKIAVNLSPVQFTAPNLFDVIEQTLAETGLAPHRLELEITERIFMEDSDNTLATLRRIKQLGVRIAMDDFGTGYSSLSYLRSFPFDKIKIDRAFVSDLSERNEHVVIVQAVVSIARALGMTTTAEGVETAGPAPIPRRARLRRGAGVPVQRAGRARTASDVFFQLGARKDIGGLDIFPSRRPGIRKRCRAKLDRTASPFAPVRIPMREMSGTLRNHASAEPHLHLGFAGRPARDGSDALGAAALRLVPEQEQPRRDDDGGPDEKPGRRHVAPDDVTDHQRPNQHEIEERRHRRRRRQMQRPGPQVLARSHWRRRCIPASRRRAAPASGNRTEAGRSGTPRS